MTIKEIEILITYDYLMDMLVYARCQLNDLGTSMKISDLCFERSRLFQSLDSIKTEVEKINPTFEPVCVYRRGAKNIKL